MWIYKNILVFCSPPHFSLLPPHSQEKLISQVLEQLSYLSWVSFNGKKVTGLCRLNYPLKVATSGWGEQELEGGQSQDSWPKGRAVPYGVGLAIKAQRKEEGEHSSFSGTTGKWLDIAFWWEVENKYFGVWPLLVLYQTAFILTHKRFFPSYFLPTLLKTGAMEQLWWVPGVQPGSAHHGPVQLPERSLAFLLCSGSNCNILSMHIKKKKS